MRDSMRQPHTTTRLQEYILQDMYTRVKLRNAKRMFQHKDANFVHVSFSGCTTGVPR